MPTVSVIVPVYNVEKYLRCCVDSILAQTFVDIEVLLVDDGSIDSSGAICDEYAQKDCRVRVFHKANGGVSSARNLGLDEATGKWVMFVDSDDKVAPQICERLLEHAMDGCIPMCTYYKWVDGKLSPCKACVETAKVYQIREFWRIHLYGPIGKLFDRRILNRENIRFLEGFDFAEDTVFNLEYYRYITMFLVIDEPMYYYRILESSLSHGKYISNFEGILRTLYENRMLVAVTHDAVDDTFLKNNNAYFFYLMNVLLNNTMHNDAPGTWFEKIRYNNAVLRSKEFKEVYPYRYERPKDFTKRYIYTLELSYKTGSYFWLWLLCIPEKIRKAIGRKK